MMVQDVNSMSGRHNMDIVSAKIEGSSIGNFNIRSGTVVPFCVSRLEQERGQKWLYDEGGEKLGELMNSGSRNGRRSSSWWGSAAKDRRGGSAKAQMTN